MKAITIHQPFAQYLADRHKQYETRSWSTNHRGLVAIHAGKTWDAELQEQAYLLAQRYPDLPDTWEQPTLGAMLAIGLLRDCIRSELLRPKLDSLEKAVGNFADGRFGWQFQIIEQFEAPIPASGQQGLWTWDFPEAIANNRVAIVGSRDYEELDLVKNYVLSLPQNTVIISGGAKGVDQMAERTARDRGMKVISIPVDARGLSRDYKQRAIEYGIRARRRNQYIVELAGSVVAFWDNQSGGTKDSIEKAETLGRPVIINPNQPQQQVLVQKTLTGFLDTYDESAYIEKSKVKAESSPEQAPFQWDKPWRIDEEHVYTWRWKNGKQEFYAVHIDSDEAKRTANVLGGIVYRSETLHLRDWLEQQDGWQDVPHEVADIGDMPAGYWIRTDLPNENRQVDLDKVIFTQDQYNVHIAMTYWRKLTPYDRDGYLPKLLKFGSRDVYYVFDGTHRTLAHQWSGRKTMLAHVTEFPESFASACGYIELDEDDSQLDLYTEILEEAIRILQGDKVYA